MSFNWFLISLGLFCLPDIGQAQRDPTFCSYHDNSERPFSVDSLSRLTHYVLVSIAPYKFFVEKIAGNTLEVGLMIPPGGSPHSFEPTAKQVLAAGRADIWFRMGEGFETRALPAIKGHHPNMQIVDLRTGASLIIADKEHAHVCAHHDCIDPHIWLSPKEAKIQAKTIANTLIKTYPEFKDQYQRSLEIFLKELEELDHYIENLLNPLKYRIIMVSHPAFAYFCRDYRMEQLSIEFEGKEPSPRQLTQILQLARKAHIKKVFILEQLIGKGARLVAQNLSAQVIEIDVLSENYLENMRVIARNFAEIEGV
jgi:zinc transport system substrate-binding protein